MKYFPLLVFIFLFHCTVYCQDDSKKPVGNIVKVKGRAYIKDPGKPQRELPAGDKKVPIFAGQELGCISKCSISFTVGQTERTITQGTYIIPNLLKRRPPSNDSISAGSKTRGAKDILLSPVEREVGVVRPESFKFRWKILRSGERLVNISPLTIWLNECKNVDNIWSESNIDYKQTYFSSEIVKDLLKKKQKLDTTESIEVVVASESFSKKQRFCFDIISVSDERRLQDELKQSDSYDDLVRHTERGYIFHKFKLYDDAAEEFEASLRISPSTDYLLAETIRTYYTLGDVDRIGELLKRLRDIVPKSPLYEEMLILTSPKGH